MSILIKGIEMPKRQILAVINPNGLVEVLAGNTLIAEFEAVHVPKHGRMIDADALMHEFEKAQRTMAQYGQEYSCSFMSSSQEISTEWYCVEDMLENAPTIIPAEEGE